MFRCLTSQWKLQGMMNMACLIAMIALPSTYRTQAANLPQNENYIIDSWQSDVGLPDNAVTDILQSRKGYLWIGTANGLARFDGVRFTTFRSVNTPELQNNQILSLYQNREGALWIGTDHGMTRYLDGHFAAFTTKDGLSSEQVLCAGEDASGQMWIGTDTGLNRLEQARFSPFFTLEGLPDDRINTMALLPNGTLVFATGKGLARFGGVRFGHYDPVPGMPHSNIRLLLADRKGDLWMADETGLWRICHQRPERQISLVYSGKVSALAVGEDGEIWFGTIDGSLRRVTTNASGVSSFEVMDFPSAITALCEDHEHDLWLGTANNGLYRLKKRQLHLTTHPAGLDGAEVSSFLAVSTNEAWIALKAGTLNHWKGNEFITYKNNQFPEGAQVRALSGSTASGLWVGTLEDGLFHLKGGQIRHWDELNSLSDNDVESLYTGGRDDVWLGTRNGGLNHLQNGRITRFLTPWGFTGDYACTITMDQSGQIWIGTTGDGLFCLSNGVFSSFTTRNGLPSDQIRTLLADDGGVLWVGTDGGLARLEGKDVTAFTKKDGLPDNEVCQLQDDNLGNLWVGCDSGIYRLRKSRLRDYAQGRTQFLDAISYNEMDGLPALQCILGAQVTKIVKHSELLWFATSKGLVRIQPSRIQWNSLPPPVVLEQVSIGNVPVPLTNLIRVPPGRERIQFQYTALSLVAPEKTRFRCQLTGFDRDWVKMGDKRTVQYTQVPPGHYQFRVLACNNDGVWNETGASVALVIAPFWWETIWFRVTAPAILGIFIFGLVRQRQIRLREMERLRVRIAGDLHDELGSSLWSITLLSQMLQKHGDMGDEERRDAGEIHRIARQTSNAVRDIVWIINPAFDTTQDLVQRMKDFAGTMLRGIEYRLHYEKLDLSRRLNLSFRENIFLMFKEILTNIAKHAQASTVEIRLEEQPDIWKITIHDDGVGFDPSRTAKGNGLPGLRRRAEKIHAMLRIDSEAGKGTIVTLTIPKSR